MSKSGKDEAPFLGRTDQLDAKELDSELGNIFTDRLNSVFKYLPLNSSFPVVDKLGPEMNFFVKFLFYYWTVFDRSASMGQQLLKIKMAEVCIKKQQDRFTTCFKTCGTGSLILGGGGWVQRSLGPWLPNCLTYTPADQQADYCK